MMAMMRSSIPPDVLLFLLLWVQAVWWFLMFVLLSMWLQISIHVFKSQMTFTPWTLPIRWYGSKAGLSWEHNRPLEDIPTSPSCDHHSVVVGEEIVRWKWELNQDWNRWNTAEQTGTDYLKRDQSLELLRCKVREWRKFLRCNVQTDAIQTVWFGLDLCYLLPMSRDVTFCLFVTAEDLLLQMQ